MYNTPSPSRLPRSRSARPFEGGSSPSPSSSAKTLALVVSILVLAIALVRVFCPFSLHPFALYPACPPSNHFAYHFFHAGLMHALINVWCFVSIVFLYDIRLRHLGLAFLIAVFMPDLLTSGDTVGLSAVCFALMAIAATQVARPYVIHAYVALVIAVMWAAPYLFAMLGLPSAHAANAVHACAYVTALIVERIWKRYSIS